MTADILSLVGFGVICFALAVVGGLAGLVLGNLRLPASVGLADTVAAGGGVNVAISGVAALSAAIGHIRARRVNWRLWAWLAPPSLVGGFVGGLLSTVTPEGLLLLAISTILFYGAWELWHWQPAASEPGGAEHMRTEATRTEELRVVWIGLVVGLLGGAVGLMLGTLRLPALMRYTRVSPRVLVGTNLLAGVVMAIAGVIGHFVGDAGAFEWRLFAVGAAASAPGAMIGARLTGRLPVETLVHTIACILLLAGTTMLVTGAVRIA